MTVPSCSHPMESINHNRGETYIVFNGARLWRAPKQDGEMHCSECGTATHQKGYTAKGSEYSICDVCGFLAEHIGGAYESIDVKVPQHVREREFSKGEQALARGRIAAQAITESLAKAILAKCWKDEATGRLKIALGNCRLNFSKDYFFNGFTKKAVKLSWPSVNGEINIQGRIEDRGDYYALHCEGWQFIEHFEKKDLQQLNGT